MAWYRAMILSAVQLSWWLVGAAQVDVMMPSPNWIDHVYSIKSTTPVHVGAYVDTNTSLLDLVTPFAATHFSATAMRTQNGEPFSDPSTLSELTADVFVADLRAGSKSAVMRVEDLPNVPSVYEPCLGSVEQKIEHDNWTAHVYVSAAGGAALKNHTDITDVAVFQMAGFKDWLLCPPDLTPEKFDNCRTFSAAEMKDLNCVTVRMNAGDALFVPRRTVHSARAGNSLSVHMTVGIPTTMTPITGHGDFITDVVLSSRLRPTHLGLDRVVDDPALDCRTVTATPNGKVLPGSRDWTPRTEDDHGRRLQSSCDYCSSSGSTSFDCGCDYCASSGTIYADCGCDLCGSSGSVYADCSCDYFGTSCDTCCSSGTIYLDSSCDYCCSSGTIYADAGCDTCCNTGSSSYDAGCDVPAPNPAPNPAPSPEPAPNPAPPTSSKGKKSKGSGGIRCFPGEAMVFTKHGHARVSDLNPMDEVAYLAQDGTVAFTTVLALTPKLPKQSAEIYHTIRTGKGNSISLTPNHYVMVNNQEKPASMVKPGDAVQTLEHGLARVVSVSTTNATGLFSPITLAGTLFVDGILVSSYGAPIETPRNFIWVLTRLYSLVPSLFQSKLTASVVSSDRFIDGFLNVLDWMSHIGL